MTSLAAVPDPHSTDSEKADGAAALEQSSLRDAVVTDARIAAAYRSERSEFRSGLDALLQILRLMLVTDAFLGQVAYRIEVALRYRGVPVLPWIFHRIAAGAGHLSIGESAVLRPGVFIPNGHVVIQGVVVVQAGATLSPWITIAAVPPDPIGPTIGARATVGTGAKVLGRVTVGANARVGANSVVLNDVPAGTTAVGMPAKPASS
jgi:serine O-acetyltransferase